MAGSRIGFADAGRVRGHSRGGRRGLRRQHGFVYGSVTGLAGIAPGYASPAWRLRVAPGGIEAA
jgi:hypothetical protein